ncbi:MAG: type II toxin-antitoxin system prevent-host-death family antitoxin [Gemmatimonadota bacterium]|jgi:hypothetical protein
MKRVTASEARRNWFRLLDQVVEGEVVVIERKGRRIQLRREEGEVRDVPDYSRLIRAPDDAADADRWGWEWPGEEGDVVPSDRDPS